MKICTLAAVLVSSTCIAAASAETFNFTIDPTRSTIQGIGFTGEVTADPQSPGSDMTMYSGTIVADVTENFIGFPGGSTFDAAPQLLPQQPGLNGTFGAAPADYGFDFSMNDIEAFAAARNLNFDLSSNAVALTGGTFDATALTLSVLSGLVDFNIENQIVGRYDLTGQISELFEGDGASLSRSGGIETLVIPIEAGLDVLVETEQGSETVFVGLLGEIVATRVVAVPEPSSVGLLLAGGLLLARRRAATS